MSNEMPLEPQLLSPYAKLRIQANAIWRGPKDIIIPALDGESFYGWSTLSLELRPEKVDHVESRVVYANLFDTSQKVAILRAVYWNGTATKKEMAALKDEETFELILPARFVKLPVEICHTWLSEFDNINITVNTPKKDDEKLHIKRLRIERDYKSNIFEKIWQTQDETHFFLNQKWDAVWTQMTKALNEEPSVDDFSESFWFVNPQVKYNFRSYQSNSLNLENHK
jgi:hypothetical protein